MVLTELDHGTAILGKKPIHRRTEAVDPPLRSPDLRLSLVVLDLLISGRLVVLTLQICRVSVGPVGCPRLEQVPTDTHQNGEHDRERVGGQFAAATVSICLELADVPGCGAPLAILVVMVLVCSCSRPMGLYFYHMVS